RYARDCSAYRSSIVTTASFFFQAEDGIRDRNVTGVQTCALPILEYHGMTILKMKHKGGLQFLQYVKQKKQYLFHYLFVLYYFFRSEERRVGKECRSRWSREC